MVLKKDTWISDHCPECGDNHPDYYFEPRATITDLQFWCLECGAVREAQFWPAGSTPPREPKPRHPHSPPVDPIPF